MYYFAHNVSPEELQAITAKLYLELLKGGYTAVVEFHYLHNDTNSRDYARPEGLSAAVFSAANQTGMNRTHLPVFYAHANFGGVSPQDAQRSMDWLLELRHAMLPSCPVHIHVAEQTKEVEDSLTHIGKPSVSALIDQAPVDHTWCLIHSTHRDDSKVEAITASGTTVGLCPLTESNLGDGIFRAVDFLAADVHFGIGSDSNICTQAMQELRTLEYSQRLLHRQRSILCSEQLPNVGSYLWQKAAHGGARAAGRAVGQIAAGCRSDFVKLSYNINGIVEAVAPVAILDFHMFSGQQAKIEGVCVAGPQIIRYVQHPQQAAIEASYDSTMQRLAQKL